MSDLSYSAQHSGWEDYPAGQWNERKPISWLHDWDFWHYCIQQYAADSNQPILELACGNGRITRQIALLGYDVVAVDVNAHFLSHAQLYLPKDVREQVTFVLQDVVQLTIGRQFQAVIMADWAFPSILTQADQLRFFHTLATHISIGGIFAFNTPFPTVQQIGLLAEGERLVWDDGRHFDPLTQIETRYSGEIPLRFRHTTQAEIELLCHISGFRIIEHYGNVDRRPLRGLVGDDLTLILQRVA